MLLGAARITVNLATLGSEEKATLSCENDEYRVDFKGKSLNTFGFPKNIRFEEQRMIRIAESAARILKVSVDRIALNKTIVNNIRGYHCGHHC